METDLPITHFLITAIFKSVFGIWDLAKFWPEIRRVTWRAADFERDEMIFLVVAEICIRKAIGSDLLSFEFVRIGDGRADSRGVAFFTNGVVEIVLRDPWINGTGCTGMIRQPIL